MSIESEKLAGVEIRDERESLNLGIKEGEEALVESLKQKNRFWNKLNGKEK